MIGSAERCILQHLWETHLCLQGLSVYPYRLRDSEKLQYILHVHVQS